MTDAYMKKLCEVGIGIDQLLAKVEEQDEVATLLTSSLLKWCPDTKKGRVDALGIAILMAHILEERCSKDE